MIGKIKILPSLKVSNHILDAVERLEEFLDSGSMTPDYWLNPQGDRIVICEKHVVIYKRIEGVWQPLKR